MIIIVSSWGRDKLTLFRTSDRRDNPATHCTRPASIRPPTTHGQPLAFYSNPPLSSLFLSSPPSQTSKRIRPSTAHAVPPSIPSHPLSHSVNNLLSLCHSNPPPISLLPRTIDPATHLFKAPIFSRFVTKSLYI